MTDSAAKKSVAMSSVLASCGMAAGKLVVGLLTGSLGILSEALHSLLDLGAAGLTYFAVSVSDRPADPGHPYGHGKVEAVSALIETGLLFVTAVWILYEAVLRLFADQVEIEVTWYSAAVMVISIIIDFSRSRALMKVAKATKSQALEADALHFSSDILSSVVVLAGLGLVYAGYPKGDAVGAIGVSLFVFHIGYGMGKRTIDVLVDAAPEGIADRVEEAARRIPGVARVELVRARPVGGTVFVEVLIRVGRVMPLDQARMVCDQVAAAVKETVVGAEAFVKAEPLTLDDESIVDTVRVAAARRGVLVHDIGVHSLGERQHVSFDIEVDEGMDIRQAHELATTIEREVEGELGSSVRIDSHIDPRRLSAVAGQPVDEATGRRLEGQVQDLAKAVPEVRNVHRIHVQQGEDGLYLTLHCRFDPATPVRAVHQATVAVEQNLRRSIAGIGRVVVHAEPLD